MVELFAPGFLESLRLFADCLHTLAFTEVSFFLLHCRCLGIAAHTLHSQAAQPMSPKLFKIDVFWELLATLIIPQVGVG